jgi:membrane dipeptidase
MIRLVAKNNGVVQVCFFTQYVKTPKPNGERDKALKKLGKKYKDFANLPEKIKVKARKEYFAVFRKYPSDLATVSDLVDHIDHIVKLTGYDNVGIGTDFDGGGGLKDCFDVSQMGNVTLELVKRGYTEEQIRKIWGGNFMRVFKTVEKEKTI